LIVAGQAARNASGEPQATKTETQPKHRLAIPDKPQKRDGRTVCPIASAWVPHPPNDQHPLLARNGRNKPMFTASRTPMRRFSPAGFERSNLAAARRVQLERLAPRAAVIAHSVAVAAARSDELRLRTGDDRPHLHSVAIGPAELPPLAASSDALTIDLT
jgi:hypothetical protein